MGSDTLHITDIGLLIFLVQMFRLSRSSTDIIDGTVDANTFTTSKEKVPYFHDAVQYNQKLFVGGQNFIYVLDSSLKLETVIEDKPDQSYIEACRTQWQLTAESCSNHIKFIYVINDTILLSCGTYSYITRCSYWAWNTTELSFTAVHVIDSQQLFSMVPKKPFGPTASAFVVFDPETAVAVAGLQHDSHTTVGDAIVKANIPLSSEFFDYKSTEVDSATLNDQIFVRAFGYEDAAYFVIREKDASSQHDQISRIIRICKSDKGRPGGRQNSYIAIFAKANLNCALFEKTGGKFSLNIIDVASPVVHATYNGQKEAVDLFYGVFSTPRHAFRVSAICAFTLKDIKQSFRNSSFINRAGKKTTWQEHTAASWPLNCSQNTPKMAAETVTFLKEHLLMAESVPAFFGNCPIFTFQHSRKDVVNFISVTVDPQVRSVDGAGYDVIFLATDSGKIYKIVNLAREFHSRQILNCAAEGFSNIIEIIDFSKLSAGVSNILIQSAPVGVDQNDKLIILTNKSVISSPLFRCSRRDNTCQKCVALGDPYCAWYVAAKKCQGQNVWPEKDRLIQDVEKHPNFTCPGDVVAPEEDSSSSNFVYNIFLGATIILTFVILFGLGYFFLIWRNRRPTAPQPLTKKETSTTTSGGGKTISTDEKAPKSTSQKRCAIHRISKISELAPNKSQFQELKKMSMSGICGKHSTSVKDQSKKVSSKGQVFKPTKAISSDLRRIQQKSMKGKASGSKISGAMNKVTFDKKVDRHTLSSN